MSRPGRREALELAERRLLVARFYLQGKSQLEIAAQCQVDQSTVSRDLQALRAEWFAQAASDVGRRMSEELAKVDLLERTYWEGWQRSCQPVGLRTRKPAAPGAQCESPEDASPDLSPGDPRFLSGVRDCIEQRIKLLGVQDLDRKLRELEQRLNGADTHPRQP